MAGLYYDRDGSPLDLMEWAEKFTPDRQRVAKTTIGEAEISTVWLGLDHSFSGGPPLIFETMVFGGPLDQEQDRYTTEEKARAGHEAWCERVKAALGESDRP